MIRRIALAIAAALTAVLTGGGLATASTTAPPILAAHTAPAATPVTSCNQLQFLGTSGVAACNLGPAKPGFISSLIQKFNPVNGANNVCQPGLPWPESASGTGMLAPAPVPVAQRTLASSYGMSGLFWAPYNLQCSEWEDLLGNSWANTGFSVSKTITSVTLTVVHAATTPNLLSGLQATIDKAVTAVGNVAEQWIVVIIVLGGAYMAWALIRGRSRETLLSVLHMVAFSAVLLVLVLNPHPWTGLPAWTVNTATQVTTSIFSAMPSAGSTAACLPVNAGDPASAGEGLTVRDHGESAIWSFMACKPWLAGEFADPQLQQTYGRSLLESQSFAIGEQQTTDSTALKGQLYGGIDNEVNQHSPGSVDLFEGNLWDQRMMIASLAFLMDLVLAVLFIGLALTLLLAQIGFYLLMVAAPIVILLGIYPGAAGKELLQRWLRRMLGLLAKMALATVLMTASLWAFALLTGLSVSWVVQGLLVAGAGVLLIAKRKQLVSGYVRTSGSIDAAAGKISQPVTGSSTARPSRRPHQRTQEATVMGAVGGYEAGRTHARSQSSRAGSAAKTAAVYSSGGVTAAGAAVGGMVHGKVQARRDARAAQDEAARSSAGRKEQQERDGQAARVHQKQAEEQLKGNFPDGKAPPPPDKIRPRTWEKMKGTQPPDEQPQNTGNRPRSWDETKNGSGNGGNHKST